MEAQSTPTNEIVIEIEPFVSQVKVEPEDEECSEQEEEANYNYEDGYTSKEDDESNGKDFRDEDPLTNIKSEPDGGESGQEYEQEGGYDSDRGDYCDDESDSKSNYSAENTPSTSQGSTTTVFIEVPALGNRTCEMCGAKYYCNIKPSRGKRRKNRCAKCFKKRFPRGTKPEKFVLPPPFECDMCSKRFNRAVDLNKHIAIHTEINKYECDICPKAFNLMGNLARHRLTHDDEKRYQCNTCLKSFNQPSYLKKHEQIHTGLKPHKCEVCEKSFNDYSTLSKHRLIHTGLKPYVCNTCSKTFNQLSSLKRHILTHTNEKNFECEICSKKFSRADRLKRHKTVHDPKKPKASGVSETVIKNVARKLLKIRKVN